MPRGKNYVNNDRGVALATHKKKSTSMEPCYYGPGCTRKDCIYRHDPNVPDAKKSNDPCLAFLAGTCAFTSTTCKKRHPSKQEADRLRAKYSQIKCRHGDDCRTTSCLYLHPRDSNDGNNKGTAAFLGQNAFPPLSSTSGEHNGMIQTKQGAPLIPGSAWKAAPVVAMQPKLPQHQQQQQHLSQPRQIPQQHCQPIIPVSAQAPAWFPGNPQEESLLAQQQQQQHANNGAPFFPNNAVLQSSNGGQKAHPAEMTFQPTMRMNISTTPIIQPNDNTGKTNLNADAKVWTPSWSGTTTSG